VRIVTLPSFSSLDFECQIFAESVEGGGTRKRDGQSRSSFRLHEDAGDQKFRTIGVEDVKGMASYDVATTGVVLQSR